MDHVTQQMPTAFPFKSSMTESSRQTQRKPVGILRAARLGDDLYEYIRAPPFPCGDHQDFIWILEVNYYAPTPKMPGRTEQLVACNLLFRQSLPFAVRQSKGEKQNLNCCTDQFGSVNVLLS